MATGRKNSKRTTPERAAPREGVEALRGKIDALDAQIVRLINQRAAAASHIGQIKERAGVKPYNPSRELEVYRKVTGRNAGPLPDEAFRAIYREIMSATIALERPTRVAYFGQPGTFAHLAARTKFGASVEYIPAGDTRDVFLAVARGHADYGVVPIENSTEGGVNESIDALAATRLKIASEIYLPIHQNLLSRCALEKIHVIYSHPQPFAQCRLWLDANLPHAERREVSSTAAAAKLAARDGHAAAIAGRMTAELYKVPILAEHIEDAADNITRFFVIAERMSDPTGHDKTSLIISIKDEPGALLHLLQPFQAHGINLTRIESRPSKRRAWEYNFFVDLEGHALEEKVRQTLADVKDRVRHLEVLGSYPAADRMPATAPHRAKGLS